MTERAPVAFRSAKPVNPKERHPITGEKLPTSVQEQLDYAGMEIVNSRYGETPRKELKPTQVTYTPDPRIHYDEFTTVIKELKQRRAELDNAIALLERLAP